MGINAAISTGTHSPAGPCKGRHNILNEAALLILGAGLTLHPG